jgi:UDP-glucuronate decarboxylase
VGPINIGNPSEFTMLELAEKVIALTNSNSRLQFKPLPKDDPQKRRPDISLAKDKLGWQPEVSLEQGLLKTIEYFDRLLGNRSLLSSRKAVSTPVLHRTVA